MKKRESTREIIFLKIQQSKQGIHTNELFFQTNLKMHSLSARLSELEQDGKIFKDGIFQREKGEVPFSIWKATNPKDVAKQKQIIWNKRLYEWLNKGKINGFISDKELEGLKKQTQIFF